MTTALQTGDAGCILQYHLSGGAGKDHSTSTDWAMFPDMFLSTTHFIFLELYGHTFQMHIHAARLCSGTNKHSLLAELAREKNPVHCDCYLWEENLWRESDFSHYYWHPLLLETHCDYYQIFRTAMYSPAAGGEGGRHQTSCY